MRAMTTTTATPRAPLRAVEEPAAYSIEEFCRAHSITPSFFYKLLAQGKAPACMTLGRRRLISREEAARWRAVMTAAATDGGDAA